MLSSTSSRHVARAAALALILAAAPALASHGLPPVNLTQQGSDGSSICAGCTTTTGIEVQLTASSDSPTCGGTYWLEFEIIPSTSTFTNVPTHTSPTMVKNTCSVVQYPFTKIDGLVEGVSYKWQVRERVDTPSTGSWVQFNGGATAFTVGTSTQNKLVFTSAAQTRVAGTCSAATTVQQRDSTGTTPVNAAASTALSLYSTSTTTTFYSDAACTTAITSTTLAAGTSTVTFYWKDTLAGTPTFFVDAATVTWAAQRQTVTPGAANKLVITTPNYTTLSNACSNVRTLQVRDSFNNNTTVTAATTVSLTSTSATMKFYSDSTCATQITSVSIPASGGTASYYFKDPTPGNYTVTAAAAGLTSATEGDSIHAKLVWLTAAQTVTAGNCSGIATLQGQDGLGAVYNAPAATTLSFSYSGSATFYSDATCTTQVTSLTLAAGTNTVSFYWKNTYAGSMYLYVGGGLFDGTSQYQTVNPGPPAKLAFTTAAQTVTAGTCSAITYVASQDIYGNNSNVAAAATLALTTSSTRGAFYSDATCTTAITSASLAAGANTVTFYWKDNNPGTPTLTATTAGLTAGTQTETVQAKLAFTSAAQTISAGTCSGLTTVQIQDGLNAAFPASANVTVSLSSSSASGPFFADSGCTTAISSVTIAAGGSSAGFYWKDTTAGTPTLTATAAGYTSGAQVETVNPGPVSALVFKTPAQTVGAGLCSAITTVEQQDAYGNKVTQSSSARAVGLASTSTGASFYSDSTCATSASSASIVVGASSGSFYWKDTITGTPTLTASAAGLTSATQGETIVPGAATRLTLTNAPQTLTAGGCSAALTVQTQDAGGNPTNVPGATTLNLSSSSGSGAFFSNATCTAQITAVTVAAGTNSATFYWSDTMSGNPTVSVSASGFSTGTQTETVNPAAANHIDFTTAEQTLSAGACSDITTLRLGDVYGNVAIAASATPLSLASTSTSMSFYSDATCSTQVTSATVAAGSGTVNFWWKDSTTGTPTLTASRTGLTSASQLETIGGRDQARFRWYSSSGTALAAENTSALVPAGSTVHLRVGVKAVAFIWKIAGGDFAASSETFANKENVTGSVANTAASDGSFETLTEARVGNGQNAYRSLGDPNAAGSVYHVYNFGTSIPGGRTTYPLCLDARTTGEALKIGWSATTTPVANPTFPAGWQITNTTQAETCFDLATVGYTGGALSVYLQDALRGAGTDGTNDTFAIDRVYVKGTPPTYIALERSTSSTFTSTTQVTAAELWNDAVNTDGAVLAPVLTGTTLGEVYVESRPNVTANQSDVPAGGQAEWDFTVRFPSTGGTHYYRLVTTDAAGNRLGTVETLSAPAVADTAASQLAFQTSAQTLVAGRCSAPVTVTSKDPSGTVRNVGAATTVNLSSTSAGATFYSDAACTVAVTNRVMAAGTSSVTFYWKDTTAGAPTLTAAAAGLTSATQAQTVNPDVPSVIAFSTAAQNVVVGQCSAIATVQSRDVYGNASPVSAATSGPLTASPANVQFYSDPGCTTAITSLTLPASGSSASFYFKSSVVGTSTVTFAPAGLTAGSQAEQFSVSVPTQLVFTSAAQTLGAGACSGATTVESRDSFNNTSAVGASTTVTLSSTSTGNTFYSNSTCTTAISSVVLAGGTSAVTFYFKDTRAGSPTLTASAAGLSSGSQVETLNPAAASKLAFTSAAQTLNAGACSAATRVQSQDTFGNASNVAAATTLTLASTSTGNTFYSDATCTTALPGSITLSAGTNTATFYFKDTRAGTPTLTVSQASLGSVTQVETINPAAASAIAFATPARTVTAGTCSAVLTVQSQDAFGNTSNASSGTTVNLSSSTGTMSFYLDAACTSVISSVQIAAGANTASFYFKDSRTGSPVITASTTTLGSITQTETVTAGAPTTLQFATAAQTRAAGACSLITTVQSQDTFGNAANVAAATPVNLTTTSTGGTFYSDSACTVAVTSRSIAAGANAASFYWKDSVAGTPTITASATGLTSATQTETITPGAPTLVAFTSAAQSVVVGQCSAAANVQSRDAYGNVSPVAAATSGPLTASPANVQFYSDAACTTAITTLTLAASSSTTAFFFKSNVQGSSTLTWSPAGLTAASQVETFGAAPPARLALTSASQTVTAGACSNPVTVTSQDTFGNTAAVTAATTVSLSSTSATLAFYSDAACTLQVTNRSIAAGTSSAPFYFRDTKADTPQVTATATGLTPGNQTETIQPAAPASVVFSSAAQTVVAGTCSPSMTLQTRDTYGNTAPTSASLFVTLQSTAGSTLFFTDAACTTATTSVNVASGNSAVTFYFRDTIVGTPTLTATPTALTAGTQVETVVAAGVSGLAISGFPNPATSGTAGSFTVRAVDAYGNTAAYTRTVSFTSSDTTAQLPAAYTFVAGDAGQRTFSATFLKAGTQTLTVTDNAATPLTASQTGIVVRPGAASALFVSGIPSSSVTGTPMAVTVEARDAAGNRATGYLGTVHFSSTDFFATLPASYAFQATDQGVHTFSPGVTFRTVGVHAVTATDTVMPTITGSQTGIQVLQALGGACTQDSQCQGGICAGGTCCATTCTGSCYSCAVPGKEGTCSPVPDGTFCPNGVFCDGQETCRGGVCQPAAPVTCTDPNGRDVMTCSEAQMACVVVPNSPPAITQDAIATAGVGLLYPYNSIGAVRALGTRPVTFSACGGPQGFRVDPSSGAVTWTPSATGAVSLCVSASNAYGSDTYTFTVNVTAASGSAPTARFTTSPPTGTAALTVAFDASGSTADSSSPLVGWSWSFGDGATAAGSATTSHTYPAPGGYQAQLTVVDAVGRGATVKQPLIVTGPSGERPPLALIVASALTGTQSLAVQLSCNCQAGDTPIASWRWDFGDGSSASGPSVTHTFGPGRFPVRLTVVDQRGYTASDSVEVVVSGSGNQPPRCELSLTPAVGGAPLTVHVLATFSDPEGAIASHTLEFSSGTTSAETDLLQELSAPGRYGVRLTVTDAQGLTCVQTAEAVVLGPGDVMPPKILSLPNTSAECGIAWRYSDTGKPVSAGTGLLWSLKGAEGGAVPDGMTVDPGTGEIRWLPTSHQAGKQVVILRVENAGGADEQRIEIDNACGDVRSLGIGCGCGATSFSSGAMLWLAALVAHAVLRRRLRRAEVPVRRR